MKTINQIKVFLLRKLRYGPLFAWNRWASSSWQPNLACNYNLEESWRSSSLHARRSESEELRFMSQEIRDFFWNNVSGWTSLLVLIRNMPVYGGILLIKLNLTGSWTGSPWAVTDESLGGGRWEGTTAIQWHRPTVTAYYRLTAKSKPRVEIFPRGTYPFQR